MAGSISAMDPGSSSFRVEAALWLFLTISVSGSIDNLFGEVGLLKLISLDIERDS